MKGYHMLTKSSDFVELGSEAIVKWKDWLDKNHLSNGTVENAVNQMSESELRSWFICMLHVVNAIAQQQSIDLTSWDNF